MAGQPPVEATIEKVLSQPGEPWGDAPQKRTYDEVLFEGESQTRKVYAPADAPTLEDGATVKGWFNAQKGHFSVAADRAPQNGGGRRSGGSGDDYERRPDHPVQMQRALHTSSLSIAPALIDQMLTIGVVPQPKDKDEYLKLVEGVATWVQSTYPQPVLDQAAKANGPNPRKIAKQLGISIERVKDVLDAS